MQTLALVMLPMLRALYTNTTQRVLRPCIWRTKNFPSAAAIWSEKNWCPLTSFAPKLNGPCEQASVVCGGAEKRCSWWRVRTPVVLRVLRLPCSERLPISRIKKKKHESPLPPDAGAHMIFPEGLQSAEEFATFAAELKTQQSQKDARQVLLMANMTEFGQSPLLPVQQLQRMGYHAVIHPVSAFRAAMRAAQSVLEALQTDGDVSRVLPSMLTRQELYALLRYNPRSPWEFPDNTPSPR
eukprot:m.213226 g.213226  ORF g.213226 m.213226 type:complete len:240 (-) comp22165_c0_seq2:51-770(-)